MISFTYTQIDFNTRLHKTFYLVFKPLWLHVSIILDHADIMWIPILWSVKPFYNILKDPNFQSRVSFNTEVIEYISIYFRYLSFVPKFVIKLLFKS
jgi:hypothetical protein